MILPMLMVVMMMCLCLCRCALIFADLLVPIQLPLRGNSFLLLLPSSDALRGHPSLVLPARLTGIQASPGLIARNRAARAKRKKEARNLCLESILGSHEEAGHCKHIR